MADLTIQDSTALPESTKDILQNLETLASLQSFAIKYGDICIFQERGFSYSGMRDLLADVDRLMQPMDNASFVEILLMRNQVSNKEVAQSVFCHVQTDKSAIYTAHHIQLAKLLDQLSSSVTEQLKAGKSFKEVIDLCNNTIQQRNRAYVQH
jgi:hypothetical protein